MSNVTTEGNWNSEISEQIENKKEFTIFYGATVYRTLQQQNPISLKHRKTFRIFSSSKSTIFLSQVTLVSNSIVTWRITQSNQKYVIGYQNTTILLMTREGLLFISIRIFNTLQQINQLVIFIVNSFTFRLLIPINYLFFLDIDHILIFQERKNQYHILDLVHFILSQELLAVFSFTTIPLSNAGTTFHRA